LANGIDNAGPASIAAQTDRTDEQINTEARDRWAKFGSADLSGDLSGEPDDRQEAEDFLDLPAFLRREPAAPDSAAALGTPGDSLDDFDLWGSR
jgi:hypothetical protein